MTYRLTDLYNFAKCDYQAVVASGSIQILELMLSVASININISICSRLAGEYVRTGMDRELSLADVAPTAARCGQMDMLDYLIGRLGPTSTTDW
jgi:hypothetical protein